MKIKLKHISWFLLGLALFFYQDSIFKENISKPIDIYTKGKECAKEALYFEARNTSIIEKEAILDVILNRMRSNKYPNNICNVINQPWQFSYKNHLKDKSKIILPRFQEIASILDKRAYYEIWIIVENRFKGNKILPNVILPEGALWYHLSSIKEPYWARSKKMQRVQIDVDMKFKHMYYASTN